MTRQLERFDPKAVELLKERFRRSRLPALERLMLSLWEHAEFFQRHDTSFDQRDGDCVRIIRNNLVIAKWSDRDGWLTLTDREGGEVHEPNIDAALAATMLFVARLTPDRVVDFSVAEKCPLPESARLGFL